MYVTECHDSIWLKNLVEKQKHRKRLDSVLCFCHPAYKCRACRSERVML